MWVPFCSPQVHFQHDGRWQTIDQYLISRVSWSVCIQNCIFCVTLSGEQHAFLLVWDAGALVQYLVNVILCNHNAAAFALERATENMSPHERLVTYGHSFIGYKTWLRAHSPLGVGNHWLRAFLRTLPPICWVWMEVVMDRWADRWLTTNGGESLKGAPARNGPFMLPVKWGLCDTHTHICHLKLSWHLALQQGRG